MLVFIYSYFSVYSLLTAIPQFVLHIQPFSSFSFTYSYFSVCFSRQLFLGLFFTYSYFSVCFSRTAICRFVLHRQLFHSLFFTYSYFSVFFYISFTYFSFLFLNLLLQIYLALHVGYVYTYMFCVLNFFTKIC